MLELIIFYCIISYLLGAGITIGAWTNGAKNDNRISLFMFFISPILVPVFFGYYLTQ